LLTRRGKADELVASRLVLLVEGGAYGMITRIKIEVVLELGIWEVHRDLVAHGLFESIEGGQLGVPPSPGHRGLEKLGEGRGNVPVVLDGALVETADAEEGADVLGAFGDGPIVMDSIFSGCFSIPSAETTKPQKSMRGMAKRHFDLLAKNFSARSLERTRRRCRSWPASVWEWTTMSSM